MPETRNKKKRTGLYLALAIVVLVAGVGGGAYVLGFFDRFFGPLAPVRDPLLDTFEIRTIPSSEETANSSSFRVREPGSTPAQATTTDEEGEDAGELEGDASLDASLDTSDEAGGGVDGFDPDAAQ